MSLRAARWLLAGFALFMLFVAFAADAGFIGKLFGFLYNYPNGDKLGHFLLYGILSLLAALSFAPRRVSFLRLLRTSLVIAAAALVEEISQYFFPGRHPDFYDLAAGLAGILIFGELGCVLSRKFMHLRSSR